MQANVNKPAIATDTGGRQTNRTDTAAAAAATTAADSRLQQESQLYSLLASQKPNRSFHRWDTKVPNVAGRRDQWPVCKAAGLASPEPTSALSLASATCCSTSEASAMSKEAALWQSKLPRSTAAAKVFDLVDGAHLCKS